MTNSAQSADEPWSINEHRVASGLPPLGFFLTQEELAQAKDRMMLDAVAAHTANPYNHDHDRGLEMVQAKMAARRERAEPTIHWPTLLLIVALPQPVGWLILREDFNPGDFALGSVVVLTLNAAMVTLRWRVRR